MAVSEQLRNVEAGDGSTRRGKIILVFSSKGGCGKTTVSTNLAAALSSEGDGGRCASSTTTWRPATSPSPSRWTRPARSATRSACRVASTSGRWRHSSSPTRPTWTRSWRRRSRLTPSSCRRRSPARSSRSRPACTTTWSSTAPPAFTDVVLKCFDLADVYVLLTTLDMPALKNLKVTLDTLDNLGFPRSKWQVVLNRGGSRVGLTAVRHRAHRRACRSRWRSPRAWRSPSG